MTSAWHDLAHYQSRDLVSRLYRDLHGRDLNATKAYAIVAAVAQGEQYFAAAEDGDDLIRPLLLYYGALSLSRAVILFRSPHIGEEALLQGHGLQTCDWSGTLTADTSGVADRVARLPDLRLRTVPGAFTSLVEASSNFENVSVLTPLRMRSQVLTSSGPTRFDEPIELTLKDILSRIPDISETFMRTFDEFGRCFEALIQYQPHANETTFEIMQTWHLGLPDEALLRERLHLPPWLELHREVSVGVVRAGRELWRFTLSHPTEADLDALPLVLADSNAQTFVVSSKPDEVRLVNLLTLYAAAFVLSNLVRYHPSIWFGLLTRSKGDFMLPLIRQTVDVIQNRFPSLVLRALRPPPV